MILFLAISTGYFFNFKEDCICFCLRTDEVPLPSDDFFVIIAVAVLLFEVHDRNRL